jgi:heme/copper-type cytochrome/quinol oxidase subunit 2
MNETNIVLDIGNNSQQMLYDLANTTGIAVDKIFGYVVYGKYIDGIIAVVGLSTILIIAFLVVYIIDRKYKKTLDNEDEAQSNLESRVILGFSVFIVTLIILILFYVFISGAVFKILAPEASAIDQALNIMLK